MSAPEPPCPHLGAVVIGYHGLDTSGPGNRGERWRILDQPATELGPDGETYTTLGRCPGCGSLVAGVSTWDQDEPWSAEHGRRSQVQTGWVALRGRGQPDPAAIDMQKAVEHAATVLAGQGVDLGPDGTLVVHAALYAALTGDTDSHMELLRRMRAAGTIQ